MHIHRLTQVAAGQSITDDASILIFSLSLSLSLLLSLSLSLCLTHLIYSLLMLCYALAHTHTHTQARTLNSSWPSGFFLSCCLATSPTPMHILFSFITVPAD